MEEAGRKIKRKTPPRGSREDTLRRLFEGEPASRMKMDVGTEESRSSEVSGGASRHRRKGKGKTPERAQRPAEKHPHDSDPFIICSDGDGLDRWDLREPPACDVGAAGASAGGGDDTPPGSDGKGL